VYELKQRRIDVWHGLKQNVIHSAVNERRHRLRACVRAQGRRFEYLGYYELASWKHRLKELKCGQNVV